jgi:hypothetical protein
MIAEEASLHHCAILIEIVKLPFALAEYKKSRLSYSTLNCILTPRKLLPTVCYKQLPCFVDKF